MHSGRAPHHWKNAHGRRIRETEDAPVWSVSMVVTITTTLVILSWKWMISSALYRLSFVWFLFLIVANRLKHGGRLTRSSGYCDEICHLRRISRLTSDAAWSQLSWGRGRVRELGWWSMRDVSIDLGWRISSTTGRTWLSWQWRGDQTRRILRSKSSCWTTASFQANSGTVGHSLWTLLTRTYQIKSSWFYRWRPLE